MQNFRDYSIKKKLILLNLLASGATLLIACTAFGAYELNTSRVNLVRSLSIQAQMVAASCASALLSHDAATATKTLAALQAVPTVLSGGVYTLSREPLAAYQRDKGGHVPPTPPLPADQAEQHWFSANELRLVRTIMFQGKPIGSVSIRSDLREMNERVVRYVGVVAGVLLISKTAGWVLLLMLQRAATRPILLLAETARVVSREKNYSVRAPPTDNHDEVGILIGAFNDMLAQIQSSDAALQKSQEELEQRVARRTAELAATNKELEAFTYSVAHDLRAPLRHIQGFADLLAESLGPQLEPDVRKYLLRIGEGTQGMGRLIEDLLSLAQVSRQEPRLVLTGLNSVVQEVLRDLKNETVDRDIRWQVCDLPFVECDPGLIKQVFYNLLSNAAKYTRPRNPAVIDIGQMSIEGQLVNFVRDNGVGFNIKYAHKLFGVFQRLHRKEDFEGTGVGLATVQRIIHKHGGRIWAEAEIGKGATFFFTLATENQLERAA